MLVKVFGGIDLIAGLIIFFERVLDFPTKVLLFIGIILLVKSSFGLLKDFGSWIDLLAGLVILSSIFFSIPLFVSIIAGALLIQKGAVSFI